MTEKKKAILHGLPAPDPLGPVALAGKPPHIQALVGYYQVMLRTYPQYANVAPYLRTALIAAVGPPGPG